MAKKTRREMGIVPLNERLAAIPQEVKDCDIEVYSEPCPALGRPKCKINPMQVYELANIHCTIEEMAKVLLISPDTLTTHFSEIIKLGRSEGKASLRRDMFAETKQRNTGMMIWLSKNYLGMRDAEPAQQTQINFNVNVNEVPK